MNKKVVIAIVVATTALAALIFSFLCFWVYHHTKYPTKSKFKSKNFRSPGMYVCISLFFQCSIYQIPVFCFSRSSQLRYQIGSRFLNLIFCLFIHFSLFRFFKGSRKIFQNFNLIFYFIYDFKVVYFFLIYDFEVISYFLR